MAVSTFFDFYSMKHFLEEGFIFQWRGLFFSLGDFVFWWEAPHEGGIGFNGGWGNGWGIMAVLLPDFILICLESFQDS